MRCLDELHEVYEMYEVYGIYEVYEMHEVFEMYEAYDMYEVYGIYEVGCPTSFITSVSVLCFGSSCATHSSNPVVL